MANAGIFAEIKKSLITLLECVETIQPIIQPIIKIGTVV